MSKFGNFCGGNGQTAIDTDRQTDQLINYYTLTHAHGVLTKLDCVSLLLIIQRGNTSLMWAIVGGCTETISVLLEAKADPNITDEVKLHYSHCLYNNIT